MIRPATSADQPVIEQLLEVNGLPTSDLVSSGSEFVVACEGSRVVGVGALERFGTTAILRSLAVARDRRGTGVGGNVVAEIERRAAAAGVVQLVLLTQTAERYFERLGYTVIDRHEAGPAVQASEQFRSLCPASATCMSKRLA